MSKGVKVFLTGILLFAWTMGLACSAEGPPVLAGVLALMSFVVMPAGITAWFVGKIKKRKTITPEEKAEKQRKWNKRLERREAEAEQQKLANTIVSAEITDVIWTGRQKAGMTGSFARSFVRGAAFGPFALITGVSASQKKKAAKNTAVTFSILYANGEKTVETVRAGSARYNELAKHTE